MSTRACTMQMLEINFMSFSNSGCVIRCSGALPKCVLAFLLCVSILGCHSGNPKRDQVESLWEKVEGPEKAKERVAKLDGLAEKRKSEKGKEVFWAQSESEANAAYAAAVRNGKVYDKDRVARNAEIQKAAQAKLTSTADSNGAVTPDKMWQMYRKPLSAVKGGYTVLGDSQNIATDFPVIPLRLKASGGDSIGIAQLVFRKGRMQGIEIALDHHYNSRDEVIRAL